MKAAIYCRVSTDGQENGSSLETQAEACIAKAKELGYDMPDGLLVKEVFSGLSLSRPGLDFIRENIRQKNIDAVIAYTTDRLSRDPVHFIILQEEMEKYCVKLILVTETVDSSDLGKLISYIRGYAAKLEHEKIKERCNRGKARLLKDGMLCQGVPGIYGYDYVKADRKSKTPGMRIVNEYEAKVVKRIFQMAASGESRFQIAKQLNEQCIPTKFSKHWHSWSIDHILTNPAYMGLTYFGKTCQDGAKRKPTTEDKWIVLPDVTPAVIDRELFLRVQRILKTGKELHRGKKTDNEYLLKGHTKCGYCGNFLVGTCLNKRFRYYHCSRTYRTAVRTATCKARYIRANEVEDIIWNKVREIIENPKVILADLQRRIEVSKKVDNHDTAKVAKEIADINRRIKDYDNREKRLIRLFGIGNINEQAINDELTRLHNDKRDDELRLSELTKTKEQLPDLASIEAQLIDFTRKIKLSLDNCDLKTKRLALDILNLEVVATPEKLIIKATVPLEFTPIQQTYEYILHPSKQSGPRKRVKKETAAIVAEV